MTKAYWIAGLVLVAGLWVEYQKDSTFGSIDTGSLLMGSGVGIFLGCMF